jgi:hypothetical protein
MVGSIKENLKKEQLLNYQDKHGKSELIFNNILNIIFFINLKFYINEVLIYTWDSF